MTCSGPIVFARDLSDALVAEANPSRDSAIGRTGRVGSAYRGVAFCQRGSGPLVSTGRSLQVLVDGVHFARIFRSTLRAEEAMALWCSAVSGLRSATRSCARAKRANTEALLARRCSGVRSEGWMYSMVVLLYRVSSRLDARRAGVKGAMRIGRRLTERVVA